MLVIPSTIGAPQAITITFQAPVFGADLSIVTAVNLNVLRRDGTTTVWPMVLLAATSRELVARYQFTGSGEITTTGVYQLNPILTLPGGTIQTDTVACFVTSPFAAQPVTEATAWVVPSSNVAGALVHAGWASLVTSNQTLSPFFPMIPFDSRAGAISATLWTANDGDPAIVCDPYNAAATHNVTLVGAGAQKIAVGDGTFASSVVLSSAGFRNRYKYSSVFGAWLGW